MSENIVEISDLKPDKLNAVNVPKEFHDALNEKLRSLQDVETNMELKKLRTRIQELEEINKNLLEKNSQSASIHTASDNRISELESKFLQLEIEKNNLEHRLRNTNREHSELIEKLSDNIRRISLQGTELESQVRTLKTKIPQLEDVNKRQEGIIESIKHRYNDANLDRIKELERNIAKLEEGNKRLEEQNAKMNKKQAELVDELEQKNQQSATQQTEFENKVAKLKGKLKELERANVELESQLEQLKAKAADDAENERKQTSKLTAELEELMTEAKMLQTQKSAFETENATLKKEVKKLKMKLIASDKDQ